MNSDREGLFGKEEYPEVRQAALDQIDGLRKEIARLQAENEGLKRKMGFTWCVYCEQEFPLDGVTSYADLHAHIQACPKHPMTALKKELDDIRGKLAEAEKHICPCDGSCISKLENLKAASRYCSFCCAPYGSSSLGAIEKELKEKCSFIYAGSKYVEFEIETLIKFISDRETFLTDVINSKAGIIENYIISDDNWRKSAIILQAKLKESEASAAAMRITLEWYRTHENWDREENDKMLDRALSSSSGQHIVEENRRKTKALEYYAEPLNWIAGDLPSETDVKVDRGERARQALSPAKAGEEEKTNGNV